MKLFCSHCGQPIAADFGAAAQRLACPHCGGANPVPAAPETADGLRAPESESVRWQEKRRRDTVLVGVAIVVLLGLLAWLLLHPSTAGSAGRGVKNAVFGQRVTEAAEQARGQGDAASGSGVGGQAGRTATRAGANQAAGAGQPGTADQTGRPGGNASNPSGQSRSRSPGAPLDDPVNPQLPANNGPELDAPEARSIGWLDRFFGQQRSETGPIQPGEGGTSEREPGAGNTNTTPVTPAPELVAAEQTRAETNLLASGQTAPPLPARARLTNPPAPPRPNDLRDNLEELLRQHHAGSGDVRISLMWNNRNDLDLHVLDPNGEEINYQHRRARSGGLLDIDMNAGAPLRAPAVENIFWPERGAPAGRYKVYVNFYARHDSVDETPFTVRVLIRGRTTDFTGTLRWGSMKKLVHEFTLGPR